MASGANPYQLWAEHTTSRLSYRDALLVVVGTALVVHQVVRKYEPQTPFQILAFIFLPPLFLSPLLHTVSIPPIYAVTAFIYALVTYITALSLSVLIYRIGPWHPLYNVPGPFLGRISKLWLGRIARQGKQHLYYQSLHARYGDFVRVGPNEVSIRLAAAVAPVLGASGLPRGPMWDGRAIPSAKSEDRSLLTLRDSAIHAERRKLWNKGFSTSALKDYEEIVVNRGKQLVAIFEESAKKGEPVDMARFTGFFTFDFMGDMAFGGGFELMRDKGDTQGVWTIIEGGLKMGITLQHVPWATTLLRPIFNYRRNNPIGGFVTKWANKRRTEGSLSRDLWHHLYEVDNSIATLPFRRVISESALAIIAGSDTTSTVLSNIWFFMCQGPEYMKRLQAEIDETFPDFEEPLNSLKLSQMPLLNAIINESMRLQPATPSGTQRAILPGTRGKAIGPRILPEDTQVLIPTYTLHRDPRYFSPLSDSFWPERWLPLSSRQYPTSLFGPSPSPTQIEADFILDTTAYIPFSFGPTACVGKNLALQEMRIIVALVAQKFEMRFAEGYEEARWFEEAEDLFVFKIGSLPVRLRARS
jgi:cytochrome P450